MKDENVVYFDFSAKKVSEYVSRGEQKVACVGTLCSETLGNAVVGIFGSKGIGLANINNVAELEGLLRQIQGSAKIIGPEEKAEEARKYLIAKGIKIESMFPTDGYVKFDANTKCVEVDEPSITYLTKPSRSANYLN